MADDPSFTVKKLAYTLPVSCCVMTHSTGVNCCQHPIAPPATRWRRMRSNLRYWWWTKRPHIHLGPCPQEDDG